MSMIGMICGIISLALGIVALVLARLSAILADRAMERANQTWRAMEDHYKN